jgi:hypothetical protein
MNALMDIPTERREYLLPGRNDLHPFEPKGRALVHGGRGLVMLRRLGILPDEWDRVYGSVVERLADQFCQLFYPVFRWIVVDPDEVGIFKGERVAVELLPGFEEIFGGLLQDVLTVATQQVFRYASGQGPGTGPGMREFEWRRADVVAVPSAISTTPEIGNDDQRREVGKPMEVGPPI